MNTSKTCSHQHLANTEINFILDKTTTYLSIPGNTDITRIRYEQECWRSHGALSRAGVCLCVCVRMHARTRRLHNMAHNALPYSAVSDC
jgi:hypothetical protein